MLSLEAPIIATAWTLGLSHLHHVAIMPGVLAGLGLSVWIVYVLDRVMDGTHTSPEAMDARHQFHHRWRAVLLGLVSLGAVMLGWLAIEVVPSGLMWDCIGLGILMMLYLAIFSSVGVRWYHRLMIPLSSLAALVMIHALPLPPGFQLVTTLLIIGVLSVAFFDRLREQMTSTIVKDVMGGMLFALGCTAWTRFVQEGGDVVASTLELLLPGSLFICNLTGISTRAAQGRWLAIGFGLVGGVLWLVATERMAESLGILAQACGIGLILLLVLDGKRNRLSSEAYRVWADLAVLAPVLYLWIRA